MIKDQPVFPQKFEESESLTQDGFLSPWIEKYAPYFRDANQEWSTYAREINRCGLAIAEETGDVVVGKSSHAPVSIAYRLLLRALTGFQSSIILAERGIIPESETLTRGIFEAGFWLGYLETDGSGAANAMLNDSDASILGALKFDRKLAVKRHGDCSLPVREVDQNIAARRRGKALSIQELAIKSGYENYYPIYKELSSCAAHASLHSLHSFMNDNGDGTFGGHVMGPDEAGIGPAMARACLAICLNLRSYASLVEVTGRAAQLQRLLLRWDEIADSGGSL